MSHYVGKSAVLQSWDHTFSRWQRSMLSRVSFSGTNSEFSQLNFVSCGELPQVREEPVDSIDYKRRVDCSIGKHRDNSCV